jgi:PAS domain S-box-containing protein
MSSAPLRNRWRASGRPRKDPAQSGTTVIAKASRSSRVRYTFALLLVIAAVAVRACLDPFIGHPSVAVFMAAILAGAWFGGVGPAILCLVLLHLVHGYWFQPVRGLWEENIPSIVSIVGWYVVGITAGVLSQMRTSAQRRAQEKHVEAVSQREHLRTTLLCMADGVLVTDRNGQVTLMNPAAERLTGWTMADAKGKLWHEVFVIRGESSDSAVESPIDRVLHEGQVVHSRVPLLLLSRSGAAIPASYSAAPVQSLDTRVTGVVLVFRDESDRRIAELALKDADRRKDEFLATLAHELRNPLAPICMGLELLRTSAGDPHALEEVRSMMHRQARHMVRLIDDLLDVSRITRGKLELRKDRVELADIVRDAIASTRPLLDASGHRLTVRLPDDPLALYADANRLTQVLANLLNNAAKYTPQGGRIELAAEHAHGEVSITVSDSGIGIPADKLDRVFDMFSQIHEGSERGDKGLGIGLTLVKRLVEMHGGSVEVQSGGQNMGTTFLVRLPAIESPAVVGGGQPAEELSGFAPRRILVVDDNADALEGLVRVVGLMGHDVRRARDGLEALETGRTFQPDIVLMDLGMPNLNGFDAARRMRTEAWGREVVIVATTGWGQDSDRRRTLEAGFDCHLVKPIPLDSLREVLNTEPSLWRSRSMLLPTAGRT